MTASILGGLAQDANLSTLSAKIPALAAAVPASTAIGMPVRTVGPNIVSGADANGVVAVGNPVLNAGIDAGGIVRDLKTDTLGQQLVVSQGPAASGAVVVGNPVLVAGSDGTNARTLSTDTSGRLNVNVISAPALTKGAQAASGFAVQDLKDSGRNVSNLYVALPVSSLAIDTLLSLTGYKSGLAVAATTTPSVVTTAKTLRINNISINYTEVATLVGSAQVTLRANLIGLAALTSPAVMSWQVGSSTSTAGASMTVSIDFPDGIEFPAGTGLAVSALGLGPTMLASASGYIKVSISGYEY